MTDSRPESYAQLARRIRQRSPRCGPVRLVAIDGHGGAGKSSFAERLAGALSGAPVMHTDDFASWDNPTEWWPVLEERALEPLAMGRPARYQPSSWGPQHHPQPVTIEPAEVVILEGASSSRQAVADRLSLSIWIEAPAPLRLERGIERDGEEMRDQWLSWMAGEDEFFARDQTRQRADVVVDGSRSPPDPQAQFIRLR